MKPATILTIGHSNHPIEKLLSLLQASGAEVVVDTRSQPYSKYTVQFNREALQSAIAGVGMNGDISTTPAWACRSSPSTARWLTFRSIAATTRSFQSA